MEDAYPRYEYKRMTDITAQQLRNMGAKAVAIDLDNTSVRDGSFRLSDSVKEWVHSIRSVGIPVVIISNTYTFRAWYLAHRLGGLPWFSMAEKPKITALEKAVKELHINISELAMVGDRLFTDVLAANTAGAISVKVEPFEPEKLFAGKYRRIRAFEKEYLEKRKEQFRAEALERRLQREKTLRLKRAQEQLELEETVRRQAQLIAELQAENEELKKQIRPKRRRKI